MAINWLVALKAVPWSDLVQAAPGIVKGARKLFAGVRPGAPRPAPAVRPAGPAPAAGSPEARLAELESALAGVADEQRSSAELIRSLAEQNERIVQAMAVLQARVRILLGASVTLTLALIALAAWMTAR